MKSLSPFLFGVAAFAVALLQGALLPSFPRPFASIDLSLILMVWLVATFHFRDGAVTAIVTGVTAGALSAMPFGTHLVAYGASTWFAIMLFTRVFTNRSWAALLGLSTATYFFFHCILALSRFARAVLAGLPLSLTWAGATPGSTIAALATQLTAVVMTMFVVAAIRRAFGSARGSR